MGNPARSLNDLFHVGEICSIKPENATARVEFEDLRDADDKPLISADLPILFLRTFGQRDYCMPRIGERVFCAFLGNGIEAGFILGGFYFEGVPPPVTDPDKRHTAFEDGTWLEYDQKMHKLTAHVNGAIDVFATGDIAVKTAANFSVEAVGDVVIRAGGNVEVRGRTVHLN